MKKSKRKIRERREVEKTFRIDYLFKPEKTEWYTIFHARNKVEAEDYFNEYYNHCEILNTQEDE